MRHVFKPFISLCFICCLLIVSGVTTPAESLGQQAKADRAKAEKAMRANLQKAMSFTPRQKVDYEKPGVAVLEQCKCLEKKDKPTGFIVHHESGRVLRQFFDNNGDGKLDQWSYFKDGIEVYRDLDQNFDGTTDQYRWLGAAGTRWGLDSDQDGNIDKWKVISPEEVAYECFQAIKNLDQERFNRLLLTQEEFVSLQLGPETAKDVSVRWRKAKSGFLGMARGQKVINARAEWVYAGNGQASMTAAGTNGSKKDLIVYDHGSGFFDSSGVRQLGVGSIIKVGDVWRLIELPEVVDPKKPLSNGGAFFQMASVPITDLRTSRNPVIEKLHDRLNVVEKACETATGVAIQKAEKDKADLLVEFWKVHSEPNEKKTRRDWLENFADSVSSAYQSNRFDGGLKYLGDFIRTNPNVDGADYVKWRAIFADYGWTNANAATRKERDAGYKKLVQNLAQFQKTYPKSPFTGDALIQLAVNFEVRNTDEPAKAIEWYEQCKRRFPGTIYGNRATGAVVRLDGSGRQFPFKGQTLNKQVFDIQKYRGKIIVLHFWETWCDDGMAELAKIHSKFDDVMIVGCNIEETTEEFKSYYAKNKSKMPWTQLHAPGTVDKSPLAHQLGIATEPMVILVDKKGNLVDTNIAFSDLERQIVRERRRSQ